MSNYRDFFKSKKTEAKTLFPEGVTQAEYQKGFKFEMAQVNDAYTARHLTLRNLHEDAQYYSKITENFAEEPEVDDIEIDAEDDGQDNVEKPADGIFGMEADAEDGSGYPKVGGALQVPHVGQPIRLGKIVQIGNEFGSTASGETSGYTNCNVKGNATDNKEVSASQPGDKEPITAGGKQVSDEISAKSVGGTVVQGGGQKQGGLNSKGHIAGTSKLNEHKNKVRNIVKEVLKEIKFNKTTGKWEKINEGTVNMKMGKSYNVVQPVQYKTQDNDKEPDTFSRTNQYDPEITEMYDDEEECMMNERYVQLVNAKRNLSEAELKEVKALREKIERISEKQKWMKDINPDHKGYCTPMSKSTCTPRRKAFAKRAKAGEFSEGADDKLKGNPDGSKVVCPPFQENVETIKNSKTSGKQTGVPGGKVVHLHEEDNLKCPKCGADFTTNGGSEPNCPHCEGQEMEENTVDMKMGPDYKVQNRQYRVQNDDQARTVEYDPEITENEDSKCPECGADDVESLSPSDAPDAPHATGSGTGYVCNKCGNTWNNDEDVANGMDEVGGAAVQHSSYRSVGSPFPHGNLPQNGKQRWSGDVD
jgi:DNA-directed RNA polymerase subunit RPC12/RpoP